MSHPFLVSYRAQFQCSECSRRSVIDIDISLMFTWPMQRYTVDYMDMIEVASQHDFLVDDNRKMICFNCVEKKHIEASLPTIAEHNPSLCRR